MQSGRSNKKGSEILVHSFFRSQNSTFNVKKLSKTKLKAIVGELAAKINENTRKVLVSSVSQPK